MKNNPSTQILLIETTERHDKVDLRELEELKLPRQLRKPKRSKPPYLPADQDAAGSRHIEDEIEALASRHGVEFAEKKVEKLDPKRPGPEDVGKNFIFDHLGLVDELRRTIELLAPAGVGGLVLKGTKDLLMQWLKNRGSREIQVKHGDWQITVKGGEDVDKAIKLLGGRAAATAQSRAVAPKRVPKPKQAKKKPTTRTSR